MNQAEVERQIFEQFAAASGWLGTVENRPPPEPDVLFRRADGQVDAFELVELISEHVAKATGLAFAFRPQAMRALASLSAEEQKAFQSRFGDAVISPRFRDNVTKNMRASAWPKMLRHLLSQPEGCSGDVSVRGTKLEDVLYSIRVARFSGFKGPDFFGSEATWVGDPTIELIEQKLGKTYKPQGRLHLLAYGTDASRMPSWDHDVSTYLESLDPSTVQFETISIFDERANTVLLRWVRDSSPSQLEVGA